MTEHSKLAPYQMHTADDGITWVTLEPLLQEVLERQEDAKAIDISKMTDDEVGGIDCYIDSLESTVWFIRALLTENEFNELRPKITTRSDLYPEEITDRLKNLLKALALRSRKK